MFHNFGPRLFHRWLAANRLDPGDRTWKCLVCMCAIWFCEVQQQGGENLQDQNDWKRSWNGDSSHQALKKGIMSMGYTLMTYSTHLQPKIGGGTVRHHLWAYVDSNDLWLCQSWSPPLQYALPVKMDIALRHPQPKHLFHSRSPKFCQHSWWEGKLDVDQIMCLGRDVEDPTVRSHPFCWVRYMCTKYRRGS